MIEANRRTISRPSDRDDWLAARAPYFNASAAAILWERHPYMTAAEYAIEKLTGKGKPDNRAMMRGRFMEAAIAVWFAHEHGVQLYEPDELFVAGPIMASVDRLSLSGAERPVEIKTTNQFVAEPMPYWLDQCQAIMLCLGAESIDLAWLDASLDMQHAVIDADEAQQTEMIARADRFMAAIELGMVPDWIVPELTAGQIAALHPKPAGEVELDDDTVGLIEKYRQLGYTVRESKLAMESIKNAVAAKLGEHEIGTVDGAPIVTWKATKDATVVDVDSLRADHPDLVEHYLTTRPGSRRFLPVNVS